jgi:hypothetical protein
MSIVTLSEAKLHLRVTDSAEDTLIQVWLNAAERAASQWMRRFVYADDESLATAKSGVQAALSVATTAYESAISAAEQLDSDVEMAIAVGAADDAYLNAQATARMTHAGIVLDEGIKAAVLITLGHIYVKRDDDQGQEEVDLPVAARSLLQPYRVYG